MTFYQEIIDRSLSQKIYRFQNHFQNGIRIIFDGDYYLLLLQDIFHHGTSENR
jgi:hypothetical protein